MPRKRSTGLPSRKQILDFIASSDQPAGKREIARAFGLSGQTKIDLKRLLKDMADEGLIDSSPGPRVPQVGRRAEGYGTPGPGGRRQRQRLRGPRAMARRHAAAPVADHGARSARRARDRRPRARAHRTERAGLDRPSAQEARALSRAGAGRRQAGRRRASGSRRSTSASGASSRSATLRMPRRATSSCAK